MDFKKKLKQRLYIAVSYIGLGFTLLTTAMLSRSDNFFLTAFGIGLLLNGIMRILRYRKITKDDQTIRKQELEENDERLRMLSERAKSWTFSFSIMAAGTVMIVLSLLGYHEEALPLAWFVCGMTVLYWICWNIIRRKY